MVLYPNKLPESERVCSGICRQLKYIKNWLKTHLVYVDAAFNYVDPTGVSTINKETPRRMDDGRIFNLQGQQVSPSCRGIVIRNGRKYFLR